MKQEIRKIIVGFAVMLINSFIIMTVWSEVIMYLTDLKQLSFIKCVLIILTINIITKKNKIK